MSRWAILNGTKIDECDDDIKLRDLSDHRTMLLYFFRFFAVKVEMPITQFQGTLVT